ncbi:MAG: hypothetical protein MRY21_07875 [Simkaniaceae bacterium]|nr:hypothetical protein [Simkaniaceae bacterium]
MSVPRIEGSSQFPVSQSFNPDTVCAVTSAAEPMWRGPHELAGAMGKATQLKNCAIETALSVLRII